MMPVTDRRRQAFTRCFLRVKLCTHWSDSCAVNERVVGTVIYVQCPYVWALCCRDFHQNQNGKAQQIAHMLGWLGFFTPFCRGLFCCHIIFLYKDKIKIKSGASALQVGSKFLAIGAPNIKLVHLKFPTEMNQMIEHGTGLDSC